MNNRLKESQLRAMVKTLLENKALGPDMVKINPVVDPSASLTDPSNSDYKPNNKQELQVTLMAMIDDLSDDKVPDVYDSLKHAMQSQEEDKGKDQMDKSNAKIEETIRLAIRNILNNIELPKRSLKEYFQKDPATGEMVWKGSGPAPKLATGAAVKKLDPEARGIAVGPKTPEVKGLKKTLTKMKDEDLEAVDSSDPQAGRTRRNQKGEVKLKKMAVELGFKNPNGSLQFMNRVLDKFKTRYENFDDVQVATLEIMKEYIDELASPYKHRGVTTKPVITPQDAELMRQHPEMIEDLETFRVYLSKKLKERGF
jgi:hypothetical protein